MVANYKIDDMEQLVSSIKQDNERTCDCFETLINTIDDYAWEMKQLANAYVQACDVKSHIC